MSAPLSWHATIHFLGTYQDPATCIASYALIQGLRANRSAKTQLRSGLILLAISPIVLVVFTVIIAMQLGASFTGAMLLPLASSVFLYIALRTERGHQVINIRPLLPFSAERITARKIKNHAVAHLNGGVGFKLTKDLIERDLIEHALEVENHNITWAAKRLGVQRTSFYSLLNKIGLNVSRENKNRA